MQKKAISMELFKCACRCNESWLLQEEKSQESHGHGRGVEGGSAEVLRTSASEPNGRSPFGEQHAPLPMECVEMIVAVLPPTTRFEVATHLRLCYIQKIAITLLQSLDEAAACRKGHVDLLEIWKSMPAPLRNKRIEFYHVYSCSLMNTASVYDHVNVLEWLKTNHTHIPDWFKMNHQRLTYTYSHIAMDQAASPEVLEWWKNSQLELKYTHNAMDLGATPAILEWWKNSQLELKYTHNAMDMAVSPAVLEWWKNSQLELKYTHRAMNLATHMGRIEWLQWWLDSGLPLRYTTLWTDFPKRPIWKNKVAVMEWWKTNEMAAQERRISGLSVSEEEFVLANMG